MLKILSPEINQSPANTWSNVVVVNFKERSSKEAWLIDVRMRTSRRSKVELPWGSVARRSIHVRVRSFHELFQRSHSHYPVEESLNEYVSQWVIEMSGQCLVVRILNGVFIELDSRHALGQSLITVHSNVVAKKTVKILARVRTRH